MALNPVLRMVPPAASAWSFREAADLLRPSGARLPGAGEIHPILGPGRHLAFSSGRAALSFLLRLLRESGEWGDEVILPAYSCYSVAAAAVRAGMRIRLCDLHPDTLSIDAGPLSEWAREGARILVAPTLLGIPGDLAGLEAACRSCGIFLIDDAAQSMGAKVGHRPVGSFGQAGIFSFGRGKAAAGWGGGLLSLRDDSLGDAAEARYRPLEVQSAAETWRQGMILRLAPLLQSPRVFRWLASLPFLQIGATAYDPSFPIRRAGGTMEGRLAAALDGLAARNGIRIRNAQTWFDLLGGLPVDCLGPRDPVGSTAIFTRFGILFPDGASRAEALRRLRPAGVQGTGLYPRSLADLPEIRPHRVGNEPVPAARRLAETLLVLPTHGQIRAEDFQSAAAALRRMFA